MRKQQGRSGRLLNARPLKEFVARRDKKKDEFSSDEENKENSLKTPERRGRPAQRRPVSYQQPLTPVRQNQQRTQQLLKDSDGVFSSSDSLDTDEVLGGVGLFSAPPQPTTEEFSIKSRKPPNTVAMARRNNAPRRNSPVGQWFESRCRLIFCK